MLENISMIGTQVSRVAILSETARQKHTSQGERISPQISNSRERKMKIPQVHV